MDEKKGSLGESDGKADRDKQRSEGSAPAPASGQSPSQPPKEAQASGAEPKRTPEAGGQQKPAKHRESGSDPKRQKAGTKGKPRPTGLLRRTWFVLLVAIAFSAGIYAVFFLTSSSYASRGTRSSKLGDVYRNRKDNFSIRPPMLWKVKDDVPGASAVITGFAEKGFNPLIVVALEIKDGMMPDYVKAHQAEVTEEDASVQWLAERDDTIDGAPAKVLEYTYEHAAIATDPFKVYCRRYIVDDHPRFYRISFAVADEAKDRYLASFEASVRTFTRLPLPPAVPRVIPDEGAPPVKEGKP